MQTVPRGMLSHGIKKSTYKAYNYPKAAILWGNSNRPHEGRVGVHVEKQKREQICATPVYWSWVCGIRQQPHWALYSSPKVLWAN